MANSEDDKNFDVNTKIIQYESFINDVLKEDLKRVLAKRDDIYSKIAEYLQLKRIIEQLMKQQQEGNKSKTSARVLTDLGCNFYCQAELGDTSKVLVCVGLETFVEFTQSESLQFINKKVNILTKHAEKLSIDSAKIKSFIKLILTGLRDLQLLEFDDKANQVESLF